MGREATGSVRVVVVGGGVAALEFVLAARKVGEGRLACMLVTPDVEFAYRPAAVAVPFSETRVFRFPIADVAAVAGARLRRGRVTQVDPHARRVVVDDGSVLEFDELVVATGARRVPVLEGAITFRGEEDVPAIERLLADIDAEVVHRVAFALPAGATWPLPLYELALLTAAHVAKRDRRDVQLVVVTPEEQPLAVFGGDVSATLRSLLETRRIDLLLGSHPASIHGDRLILVPPKTLPVDRVVCMPTARGIPIPGLPHDFEGFLPVDGYGRVSDLANIYALGDATNHPIKQGGIAAQQADGVAQLLAHQAGAPVDLPPRYSPSLKGLLLTGDEPHYLLARPAGGHGAPATISTDPLWWPGGKIAAPHLGNYLATAAHR